MAHPTPEEEIVLLSAGTLARREAGRERLRDLAERVDWRRLAEVLGARRLLITLGPRIVELAGDQAPHDFRILVNQSLAAARRRGASMQLVTTRIMDALAGAGIRSSTLKGPSLGEAIFGEPGRRESSDIDLLVPKEQLRAAVEVVRGLGYSAPMDHRDADGLPLLHFALAHARAALPPVELHWRIHWYERDFARERLLPPSSDSSQAWRPAPVDQLAALLLFYVRDGFIGLRLATDLGAWWDAFGLHLQPDAFGRLFARYPTLRRPLVVAVRVAEKVVGLPATKIIGKPLEPTLRERVAARMTNPNPQASPAQLYADIGLVDCLLMPPGDLHEFVRRQVLVPRDVRIARARSTGARRPVSSVGHGARVVGRYGLAIARLPAHRGP